MFNSSFKRCVDPLAQAFPLSVAEFPAEEHSQPPPRAPALPVPRGGGGAPPCGKPSSKPRFDRSDGFHKPADQIKHCA